MQSSAVGYVLQPPNLLGLVLCGVSAQSHLFAFGQECSQIQKRILVCHIQQNGHTNKTTATFLILKQNKN
jgi:hypothetical protein